MPGRRQSTPDPRELGRLLENSSYIADPSMLTTLYIALTLKRPLLVEGEPGCGKTELAKVLSDVLSTDLIRLQCYEGLDVNSTIYEWDYLRQLLKIKMEEGRSSSREIEPEIFSRRFLLKRPLLKAVTHRGKNPPVLLIDEVDRADEEFEGFLLEFLGEFQVTVPELGTFRARRPPVVVITSNRTRELGDGLRRRCIYLRVDLPSVEKELMIVRMKVPGIREKLAKEVVHMMEKLRKMEMLTKKPGVAETIDWASALLALGREELDRQSVEETLGCVVKTSDELQQLQLQDLDAVIAEVKAS